MKGSAMKPAAKIGCSVLLLVLIVGAANRKEKQPDSPTAKPSVTVNGGTAQEWFEESIKLREVNGQLTKELQSEKAKALGWYKQSPQYKQTLKAKQASATGHWETRCNGNSCQRVWVEGPSEQKGPVKQSPAARTEPQSFQPVRRGLFGGRFR
jgi:hypothetical protein